MLSMDKLRPLLTATLLAGSISAVGAAGALAATPTQTCGTITQYIPATPLTNGLLTIGGHTYTIGSGATTTGNLSLGSNSCVTTTQNSQSQVTSLTATGNSQTTATYCGTVTSFTKPSGTTPGQLGIGGQNFTLAPGTTVDGSVQPGQNACATLTFNGDVRPGSWSDGAHRGSGGRAWIGPARIRGRGAAAAEGWRVGTFRQGRDVRERWLADRARWVHPVIAALSRVVLTGGSRVLPSVDLAPDADPRSRLPRALTLLAAVEIPVVLAGAVGQALPLGYRDVVALVVMFAFTVAVMSFVPLLRVGSGWLLVPVGAHIVFVATLVALTGGWS